MTKESLTLSRILLISVLLVTVLASIANLQSLIRQGYPATISAESVHDVAISSVTVSKNTVVRGELVSIYVTTENQGDYTETFDVSAYANTVPVSMPQTISNLAAMASQDLTFTWNTADLTEGYYQIKAQASIVFGEVDTADNTLIDGTVNVKSTATAGTSDFYLSTNLPFQRKAFHAEGLHWVFYSDYKNMVYKTSSNGINWSPPTAVREAMYGYLFSIWLDGAYVHYAYRDSTGIFHRRGSINGGTITWDPEHLVISGNFWAPNICVDTNGFPWISYRTNDIAVPADTKPYIIKATTPDGAFWGPPKLLSTLDKLWWTVPTPLSSGRVYVLYSYPNGPICGNLWNGNSWLLTPETATPINSTTGDFGSFSAVAKSDNIYVVYLQNFTCNLVALNRTNSVWGEETTLVTLEGGQIYPKPPDPLPTISVDPRKGNLYVRWIGCDITLNTKLQQIRYDATDKMWSNIETPFGTIFLSPDPRSLSSYYQVWDSTVGSAWVEGTSSPYSISYASQRT